MTRSNKQSKVIYIKGEGEDLILHTNEELNLGELDENSIEITAADFIDQYADNDGFSNRVSALDLIYICIVAIILLHYS